MDGVQIPRVGDTFLGSWRIAEQVGEGGFSIVFRALGADGRVAALKILLPEADDQGNVSDYDEDLVERFLREARLLRTLDSPYTIRMWDYGQSPGGLLYMVFEFIDGRSLFHEIKHGGPMASDRVIHILRQTLIGLQTAHDLGILHRDIKPNNIMLFQRGEDPDRVKLVDFGIAKMYGEAEGLPGNDLTAAGLLVGTPRYMSPEQLKGTKMGPPSDVYSMGLCAVEMLTGRKCIPGKDRFKIVEAQLRPESITLPADLRVDPGLRDVVHRMIQKEPAARFGSAADALRALESLAGDPGATGDTVFESVPASLDIPEQAPKPDEEHETVLHRVDAQKLDSLISEQEGETATPYDETVAVSGPPGSFTGARGPDASQSNSGLNPHGSGQHPQASRSQSGMNAYGSGQHPQASRSQSGMNAYGSGQHPQANRSQSGMNAYGSGQHPQASRSQSGMNAYGSGQHPQANRSNSGLNTFDPGPGPDDEVANTNPFEREEPPPDSFMSRQNDLPEGQRKLEDREKIALVASFLLPGVGHLLLGQRVKGIGALVLLLVTVGFGWILLAPAALIDAFLVIRARKRRTVEDLEFFPDAGDLL